MREIVLDTETTGFDPQDSDRIVEIGCLELINYIPSGDVFHVYINPERSMPASAFAVHGLSDEFLADKPLFADVADDFTRYISGARLIIHNAPFDTGFLNMELARVGREPIMPENVVDTLAIARRKFPGASNSLDALCKRFNVDNSNRTQHGALLDAELLTEVYIELIGGKQAALALTSRAAETPTHDPNHRQPESLKRPAPLIERLSKTEQEAHDAFIDALEGTPIWRQYQ